MIPPFSQLKMPDRVLESLQKNVAAVLKAIAGVAITQGMIASFTSTALINSNTDFVVSHSLGRPPVGVIPMVGAIFPGVYAFSVTQRSNSSNIFLRSSANIPSGTTIEFWVY
jgi:hypothetical protein